MSDEEWPTIRISAARVESLEAENEQLKKIIEDDTGHLAKRFWREKALRFKKALEEIAKQTRILTHENWGQGLDDVLTIAEQALKEVENE